MNDNIIFTWDFRPCIGLERSISFLKFLYIKSRVLSELNFFNMCKPSSDKSFNSNFCSSLLFSFNIKYFSISEPLIKLSICLFIYSDVL